MTTDFPCCEPTAAVPGDYLLDHLMDAGYEPADFSDEWYDLTIPGTGSVRVIVSDEVYVHMFDQYWVNLWTVTMSSDTPESFIVAAIEAAEWQLAARRGGPVTPAQEATAR